MSVWSEDRVTRMRELAAKRYTAREIADRLGDVTRNMVIGKMRRLGIPILSGGLSPTVQTKIGHGVVCTAYEKARRIGHYKAGRKMTGRTIGLGKIQIDRAETKARERVNLAPPEVRNLTLFDLGPSDCRWPLGDGPYTFCGCPQSPASSYCDFHHALSIQERMPVAPPAYQSQPMSRVYRTA